MKKIGNLALPGTALLAPMADYTNVAFRTLCKEYGSALVYTELTSAKALLMKSKRTMKMLAVSEKEKPAFLQLFGSEPADFKKAVEMIEAKWPDNFAGYDLNCGCSVPKALRGKYGCSLMNEPLIIGQVVAAMKNATEKPVTVKLRLGLKEETFLKVALEAEKNGVNAIALHARLGEQGYLGNADWSKIKLLKQAVKVPVIGNGDIRSPEDVLRMEKETRCDFVMVGRAAIGNAFFFTQANALVLGKEVPVRGLQEMHAEAKRFLQLANEFSLGVNDVRPYFIGMSKGITGAAHLRNKFAISKSTEEIATHLEENFSKTVA